MLKTYIKKFWLFIWEENSIWSWLANIVLAFILIKYMLFPALGFALGSAFPVVAVVSGSMQHSGSFDEWWSAQEENYKEFGITKEQFRAFDFNSGLDKGDVIILISPKNLKVGDIAVLLAKDRKPIIHRVVALNPAQTKGDSNKYQIVTENLNEKDVSNEFYVGKAGARIPWIGYIKIWFAQLVSLFGLQVS